MSVESPAAGKAVAPSGDFTPPPPTSSLAGAIALVAGTTVGAGILALPAKTLAAGIVPTTGTLLASWVYMASSGLLIAEVNVNTLCALERSAVSLSTMTEETLGVAGSRVSSLAYVFIHYTLLVAYMLQGGTLLLELGAALPPLAALPAATAGPPLFAALLGGALLLCPPAVVEKVNAVPAIPVMVLSLVYHNVVPTICYQLGCDLPRIRTAILAGSAIPTLMFIAWCAVILGSVPFDAADAAVAAGETFDPLALLRSSGDAFGEVVRVFSLLAVSTSFVGFYYGLTDFFADALGLDQRNERAAAAGGGAAAAAGAGERGEEPREEGDAAARRTPQQRALLTALALLPPLGFALSDPSIFFSALDNAGTYGILTLFGIIPAAMAWAQRYGDGDAEPGDAVAPAALPGGRATLVAMIVAAG
ncbi:hypothetical protein EMIHUDRAFT_447986, partial [Emiliania huxleyi CCMP1516]|uniref:Amino acid transporter transmembrane domain-containing protein n=2 Tax=Emiliania huxleyi TaxID=2903 RepID=A0A0D3J3Z7_EMIH1